MIRSGKIAVALVATFGALACGQSSPLADGGNRACTPGDVRAILGACGVCGTGMLIQDECDPEGQWRPIEDRCDDPYDDDGDTYANAACDDAVPLDCNDDDPSVHPASFECTARATQSCTVECSSYGTRICGPDCSWGPCELPPESCNRRDDDCDGLTDEDFDCRIGTTQFCETTCGTAGTRTCGRDCRFPAECTPPTEQCDAVDDDCDGATDEGLWCWVYPVPTGDHLLAISGTGSDDIWAVGERGTILHRDRSGWRVVPSGFEGSLRSVWAASSTDAWAIASSAVLRWDGRWWRPVDIDTDAWLQDVWGASAADVWIVGSGATILRFDGAEWRSVSSPVEWISLNAVWGASATDVWAVGDRGTILHWDGSAWTSVPSGTDKDLTAVWGASPTEVFAAGELSICGHLAFDGSAWATVSDPFCGDGTDIWGSGPNDVWFTYGSDDFDGGMGRWDGTSASRATLPIHEKLGGVWGASANDVWAVGNRGTILHWDGAVWTQTSGPPPHDLTAGWGPSGDDFWAVGRYGTAQHWNGTAWTEATTGTEVDLRSAWGFAADDIWAVGGRDTGWGSEPTTVHWNGSSWTTVPSFANDRLEDVWGPSPDDVWAVGARFGCVPSRPLSECLVVLRNDGSGWAEFFLEPGDDHGSWANAIWGVDDDDVWVVGVVAGGDGGGAVALHWNGTEWTRIALDGGTTDAWGFETDDVWTVGTEIYHWNGGTWTSTTPGSGRSFQAVWGPRPDDVWSVTSNGAVFHWTGSEWNAAGRPGADHLWNGTGVGEDEQWVFGELSAILRRHE